MRSAARGAIKVERRAPLTGDANHSYCDVGDDYITHRL